MSRAVVVVDVETSALVPNTQTTSILGGPAVGLWGEAVEVAWWNLTTGEHATFVPAHSVERVRASGEPKALVVNRYLERLVDARQDDGTAVRALASQLEGATLAGSNPSFDARFLGPLFVRDLKAKPGPDRGITRPSTEPWHHRLLDLSAFAAGRLGLPMDDLPGLAAVCERLDVDPPDHTAEGDVRATGECFRLLQAAHAGDDLVSRRSVPVDDPRIDEAEYDAEPGHGLLERIEGDQDADRYERTCAG